MKFKQQVNVIEIIHEVASISDTQVETIKSGKLIPLSVKTKSGIQFLENLKYPIDPNSPLKLVYYDKTSIIVKDSFLEYEVTTQHNETAHISFESKRHGFNLKHTQPLETIFLTLKSVVVLFMRMNKLKRYNFSFIPIKQDEKGDGMYDIKNITLDFLIDMVGKDREAKKILDFNEYYSDVYAKKREDNFYIILRQIPMKEISLKSFLQAMETFKARITRKAKINNPKFLKMLDEVISVLSTQFSILNRQNKIANLRARMYLTLLKKLGKNVRYDAREEEYRFVVNISDLE